LGFGAVDPRERPPVGTALTLHVQKRGKTFEAPVEVIEHQGGPQPDGRYEAAYTVVWLDDLSVKVALMVAALSDEDGAMLLTEAGDLVWGASLGHRQPTITTCVLRDRLRQGTITTLVETRLTAAEQKAEDDLYEESMAVQEGRA
jgi:hypothetical protein